MIRFTRFLTTRPLPYVIAEMEERELSKPVARYRDGVDTYWSSQLGSFEDYTSPKKGVASSKLAAHQKFHNENDSADDITSR